MPVVIVETKGSKRIRIIDSKPTKIHRKRKTIRLAKQSSNYQITMRCGISVFEERLDYTTDGANKVDKAKLIRLLTSKGATKQLPMPCWKSFDKRRKQWKPYRKKGSVIYPSARILNELGKCIFPEIS